MNMRKRRLMSKIAPLKRVLIIGSGSIGKRHAECLKDIYPDVEIVLVRHKKRKESKKQLENLVNFDVIEFDLENALASRFDMAIVANPSPLHAEMVMKIAEFGVPVLVEKPITNKLETALAAVNFCKEKNVPLKVGYVLRFNPSLNFFRKVLLSGGIGDVISFRAEVGQYLPDWRPGTDYRKSVSGQKRLGGGALLELSHEIDYIGWIFGKVTSVQGVANNSHVLGVDVEESVEAILELKSQDDRNIFGSLHLDMLQRAPYRICRAVGSQATLKCNLLSGSVKIYDGNRKDGEELNSNFSQQKNQMYKDQLSAFFGLIEGRSSNAADGVEGVETLKVIEGIKLSAQTGQKVLIN